MVEAKVYSASYCPWCDKAVEFLKKFEDLDVWIVDVTDNQELRETISKKTGQNTVPQIWIGNTYVGGHDAMMKMASTKELELIANDTNLAMCCVLCLLLNPSTTELIAFVCSSH